MSTSRVYQRVHEERNAVHTTFQEKWEEADENKRFVRLLQYSDEQLQKFKGAARVPYVLDFITQPINTAIGDQRDSRTDIKYLPVEPGDEVRAELLNAVKDTILRRNRWAYLESDVFMDGIIEKAGAVGYEWSTVKHPLGSLKIFRVPIRQLTWDINRREYDTEVGSWMSRTRMYPKRELKTKYPEYADQIDAITFDGSNLDDLKLDPTYFKSILNTDLSWCALIEFYERRWKNKFFITQQRGGEPLMMTFNSQAEAEDYIEQQKAAMERQNEYKLGAGIGPDQPEQPVAPEPSWDILKRPIPIIIKSEVASNVDLVAEEEQDMPFFPYDVYYPFWEDGEYWGVVDMYKDPQKFINKMFSMVDHQIATNSKGLLLIDDIVPEATAKKIMDTWSTTGGAMQAPDPKNTVVFIKPDSFDPKLLEMISVATANIEKKAGGANFLGRQQSANESGVAVEKRVQRASTATFMIYDNLDRFKLSVGEKIAWYISNRMTAQQKIRIEGDQLTEFAKKNFPNWLYSPAKYGQYGFMEINSKGGPEGNTLDDLQTDIIVDQSAHAATKNQATLMIIQQMLQSSPLLAETIPPQLLISLFDLPASKKEEMMKAAADLMQARQEAQKNEQNKPPTLSANMKDGFGLPPDMQAQFFALFGLQVPQGTVVTDPAAEEKAKKDQMNLLNAVSEREFKRDKHHDQTALKMAEMLQKDEHEKKKLEVAKQRGASNGKSGKSKSS